MEEAALKSVRSLRAGATWLGIRQSQTPKDDPRQFTEVWKKENVRLCLISVRVVFNCFGLEV
jgi:hypothetical protein